MDPAALRQEKRQHPTRFCTLHYTTFAYFYQDMGVSAAVKPYIYALPRPSADGNRCGRYISQSIESLFEQLSSGFRY